MIRTTTEDWILPKKKQRQPDKHDYYHYYQWRACVSAIRMRKIAKYNTDTWIAKFQYHIWVIRARTHIAYRRIGRVEIFEWIYGVYRRDMKWILGLILLTFIVAQLDAAPSWPLRWVDESATTGEENVWEYFNQKINSNYWLWFLFFWRIEKCGWIANRMSPRTKTRWKWKMPSDCRNSKSILSCCDEMHRQCLYMIWLLQRNIVGSPTVCPNGQKPDRNGRCRQVV